MKARGTRLNMSNIKTYLDETYPNDKKVKSGTVSGFPALLQSDYGGDNDCTITSITALCYFKKVFINETIQSIYNRCEAICKKLKLNVDKNGTPFFLNNYLIYKILGLKSAQKYLKNVGFNWNTITAQIDNGNPVLLSLYNDGRNYYRNHTVSIIGYMEYEKAKILIIYDNWYKTPSYLDYNKLCNICCINYLK